MIRNLGIVLLFQAAWFACVLSAANGAGWIAIPAVAISLSVYLSISQHRRADALLIPIAAGIGLVGDSLLMALGIVEPAGALAQGIIIPLWLIAMWANLAMLFNGPLEWMHGRVLLQIAGGAIGGPSSYWAGARLGAVELGSPALLSLLVLAAFWGAITPLLFLISSRLTLREPVGKNSRSLPTSYSDNGSKRTLV